MADKVQIFAGDKEKLPVLLDRELGYCKDTQELYIGTSAGNKLVGSVVWGSDISSLRTEIEGLKTDKLTANQAEEVAELATEADLASVITAVNDIIGSLKAAAIME